MLVIILLKFSIASIAILLGSLNSKIVSSSILKSSTISFLGKSTLGFPDSLAISTIILSNYLASTDVLSNSLNYTSSILSTSLSRLTTNCLTTVSVSLSLGTFAPPSTSSPI